MPPPRTPRYSRAAAPSSDPADRADRASRAARPDEPAQSAQSGRTDPAGGSAPLAAEPAPTRPGVLLRRRWDSLRQRHPRTLLVGSGALGMLLVLFLLGDRAPAAPSLTQRDIDLAVVHALENLPAPPSVESVAYQIIRPSVVRVQEMGASDPLPRDVSGESPLEPRSEGDANGSSGAEGGGEGEGEGDPTPGVPGGNEGPGENPDEPRLQARGLGTGVVVEEDGTILTNLHVVYGVERIEVVFADGSRSPARLVGVQADMDLAVIRADELPDDLIPATLRSTRDLHLGDRVMAVGFPFGIGPSMSSGVVSGLRREFRSPEGETVLTNLIQFDAAANPGNSGGPLITEDGSVVGIVTAILNPNNQRSFVGIAFAVPIETAMQAVGNSPF